MFALNQVVFTIECVVKLVAEGEHPRRYFEDPWNAFDFVVVVSGFLESALPFNASVLRLVKLLRVFKLARTFPSLRIIVEALLGTLSSVSYIMVMIVTLNFIFASMGILFFGANDPEHFGDLPRAMMAVWQTETLDGWEDTLYINMYGCNRYGYYDLRGWPTTGAHCSDWPGRAAPLGSSGWPQQNATATTSNATAVGGGAELDDLGHGWLAFLFFFVLVIVGAFVLPTVLIGVISISFEKSTAKVGSRRAAVFRTTTIVVLLPPSPARRRVLTSLFPRRTRPTNRHGR